MIKNKYFIAFLCLLFLGVLPYALRRHYLSALPPAPDYRILGPGTAAIHVIEFSDFSCPACAGAWAVGERYLREYPAALKIEFRHYPLTEIHPRSFEAALYADCAGKQGRFREYAALLFEKQTEWSKSEKGPELLAAYAGKTGLEAGALAACLADPETAGAVRADMAAGERREIGSTPTFFINGKRAVGPAQLVQRLKHLTIPLGGK